MTVRTLSRNSEIERFDLFSNAVGRSKIIRGLQVKPEVRCGSQRRCKASRRVYGHRSSLADKALNPGTRYAKMVRHSAGGHLGRDQVFVMQNTPRMDCYFQKAHNFISIFSVVINNFHVLSRAIFPRKANAPLVVNSDRVLALTVVFEGVQAVARRRSKIVQNSRRFYHSQLVFGGSYKLGRKPAHPLSCGDGFGNPSFERSDHAPYVSLHDTHVNHSVIQINCLKNGVFTGGYTVGGGV